MAQEISITYTCDLCTDEGRTAEGETVTVPAMLGEPAFELEVCRNHRQPLANMLAVWARLGRKPERRASGGQKRTRADYAAPEGGLTCPTCQITTTTTAQLRSHLRKTHGQSLADVGLEPAVFQCPECDSAFGNGQGMAAHIRSIHGITGFNVEEARKAS